jgi:amino acid adenylation domain-containing protein
MMERSNWNIVAMIGVLKSGASYLPLDISYPIGRIAAIIEEAKVEYILCFGPTSVAKDLPEHLFLDIEQIDFSLQHVNKGSLPKIELDTPAYVIYTSGSTGKPKGVQVSHNSLSAFVLGAVERYEVTSNDRVLQFASPTFDAAVEEIYCALCAGASLVVRNETMISSIEGFVAEVNAKQITVLDLPTAFWKQVVAAMLADRLSFHNALRLVIIGGEKADAETTQNYLDYFGKHPRLINTYGPTEATVVATTCYLDEIEFNAEFPIGKQLGETTAWVTDRFYNLVPQGIEGQLVLGGPQVAMGYLNDPELTLQRFIPDTFSGIYNKKLYVTGDRVVIEPNGNLLFKGRIDSQVKIRGFRIDLKEVNDAIRSLNPVKDCLTLVKQLNNAERLVAYVIPHTHTGIDERGLRESIKKVLPDYMLPSAFVFLEAFPLTRHMKIDYASLPLPNLQTGNDSERIAITPTQIALKELFEQVLKLPSCRLSESFFHQGGDSLLALSVVSKTSQLFGIQLTIGAFYQNPSIISLARFVEEQLAKLQNEDLSTKNQHELVCLKQGKGLPPLVTIYFDAANKYMPSLVEEDRPVYTIIPQGSDGEPIKLKTVESLAAHYLDLLNQELPNQCIVLAGFSFGGLVALEMAIQMQSKACILHRAIIVDTLAPHLWKKVFAPKVFVFKRVYLAGIAVKAVCRLAGKPIPLKYRNSVILRSWRKAAKSYKPDGKAEIILIKSSHSVSDEPLLGWQEYSEIKTRLRLIEGSHHSIIRDYKKVVTIVEWILNEQ